jgi:hypothetical protein
MTTKLYELLERVNSKQTFFEFVDALKEDLIDEIEKESIRKSNPYGPGVNGWQNLTIVDFLDAMHSFGEDSGEVKEEPDWKMFALLLFAGKMYE